MTGDPRRDHEHTEHNFIGGEDNDYVAAKQARAEDTCGRAITVVDGLVDTACGRPSGHDGDCHPVPLTGDEEGT